MIGYSRPARQLSYDPQIEVARLTRGMPRPTSIAQTGISLAFLADLTAKHLASFGVLPMSEVIARLGLPGPVVEQILQHMRAESLVEVRSRIAGESELRYGLTERGRVLAYDAMMRSGYLGPAPVALEDYCDLVEQQSIRRRRIERTQVQRALSGIVVAPDLCDRLGPAMNSGRAIFIYGAPGTGKTCVAQHVARVLPDLVLIPYAIAVHDVVVELFDPQVHVEVSLGAPHTPMLLAQGWDARYACCERPVVTAAGELTIEMLEIQRDALARTCRAPLQLKANNGVFLIDDLGRQRIAPRSLFDRWIVPLEESRDYLSAGSGQHFAVPFDQLLIFSTNLEPADVAEPAFLRRIGHKIELKPCDPKSYREIWRRVCLSRDVECDPEIVTHVLEVLHARAGVPPLPCHPRDLIGMALDLKIYRGEPARLDIESVKWAWDSYFIDSSQRQQSGLGVAR